MFHYLKEDRSVTPVIVLLRKLFSMVEQYSVLIPSVKAWDSCVTSGEADWIPDYLHHSQKVELLRKGAVTSLRL